MLPSCSLLHFLVSFGLLSSCGLCFCLGRVHICLFLLRCTSCIFCVLLLLLGELERSSGLYTLLSASTHPKFAAGEHDILRESTST